MHEFLHKFPTTWENAAKPMVWGKVWEIDNHTFPRVWMLYSHLILILWYTSAYGTLGNVWVSP